MALLPNIFVPEDTETADFSPIPAGWYEAELIKSKLETTKDKTGKYLAFTFKVIDGDYDGRLVFTNLNIVNKNETAVKIANSDLKKICEAVGFAGELEDTEDLHNIPLMVKASVKPETAQWPAKNELKDFKAVE